jgi:hypothetical protein
MTPFIFVKMGQNNAGQPLTKIVLRKEAERETGGDFWWGLGTPLGPRVESVAVLNGGTLSVLFSALDGKKARQDSDQTVRLWNGWRSIRPGQRGTIPEHVIVLGGNPDKPYYALVCRSDVPILLGDHGPFDPTRCKTVAKGKAPGPSQRAALLTGETTNVSGEYRISFKGELTGPWYVRLTDDRVLTAAELAKVHQYKHGDNWLSLCSSLRV